MVWLLPALLAAASGLQEGASVLITRGGEKVQGPVRHVDGAYIVETASGPRKFPESEVGLVFESLRDVTEKADARFAEAKRLYEEARQLDEAQPARNQKLALAIEIAQGSVATYQLLQPHYPGTSGGAMSGAIQVRLQFIRLCRGAATADVAVGAAGPPLARVVLEEPAFSFSEPPAGPCPWAVTGELGGGLGAAAHDLTHPEASRRLEAVKRLTHPPSPLHLPALLRTLEAERDPSVLGAFAEGLGLMDSAHVLRSLSWVKRESDPLRRDTAFQIVRAAGDRGALDFLLEWFEASPPATPADRAAFASSFRQQHAQAIPLLRELLTKNRNPKLQAEVIRQLGVISDKTAAPMLLKTLPAYPKESAVSLFKLGKPGIPTLIEGARSSEAETHRICSALLRRITGIQQPNLIHFETWWAQNRKAAQDEERAWWEDQARKGWPVDPAAFSAYELPLESIVP